MKKARIASNKFNARVGDKVWIGFQRNERHALRKVVRLTNTQMVTFENHERRYDLETGRNVHRAYGNERVTGLATPQEIEQWEQKLAGESALRRQREAEMEAKRQNRQRLQNLFPAQPFVDVSESGGLPDKHDVTFYSLSDGAVKHLAALVQQAASIGKGFDAPEVAIEHDGTVDNTDYAGGVEPTFTPRKLEEGNVVGSMKTGKEYVITNISARHLGDMYIKRVDVADRPGMGRRVSMTNPEFVFVRPSL